MSAEDYPLRHTKHIFRVFLLLVLGIVAIVLGRSLFVPPSWGIYGWYRADNVEEQRQHPVVHGGDASCKSCHEEALAKHQSGPHQVVRCEACHAPLAIHVAQDKKAADMPTSRSRDVCLRCHRQLEARPDDFPQVQPRQHVDENGGEWSEEACLDCHEAHQPK